MKYNYFVLGYNGINYFNTWFDEQQFPNTNMKYVDNGRQQVPTNLQKSILHKTATNIGCAGGWNLICDIGFNYYNHDVVVVGQEDARVSEDVLEALVSSCTPNSLCGTYDNSFEFSTFAIHKETFNKIGRFDENFVYVGCEDNDYKYRCKLAGVDVYTLGISHTYNCSMANNDTVKPKQSSTHNATYIENKWKGYTYKTPFDNQKQPKFTDYFKEVHGDVEDWPSKLEYKKFLNENSISQ